MLGDSKGEHSKWIITVPVTVTMTEPVTMTMTVDIHLAGARVTETAMSRSPKMTVRWQFFCRRCSDEHL